MSLPALLASITTHLASSQDPHSLYDLNVQISDLGALLSRNDAQGVETRRHLLSPAETSAAFVDAWKTVCARLEEEDERNRDAREQAAAAVLDKSRAAAAVQVNPVTTQLYETVVQLARLTRDLLPGVADAKRVVLPCEPSLRALLYRLTTFDRISDPELVPAHRAILQLLSNLVAPVAPVDDAPTDWVAPLWRRYTTGKREDAVIIRILDSEDAVTSMSCIMLIFNFIRADPGISMTLGDAAYRPVLAKVLDKIGGYSDAESGSAGERCFHLGYQLFSMLFHRGLQGSLFALLASPGEPVTPSQTTLLQLLDGYHHNSEWDASPRTEDAYAFLIPAFFEMATYAIGAMTPALSRETERPSSDAGLADDPKLPKVFEACILACQCMITVCLAETEHLGMGEKGLLRAMREARRGDKYLIEVLIDLLRTTESFIPRIKPFRPADPSSTANVDASGMAGFAPLKRDLVQLAGLLANDDQSTQDLVRECGGMQVILSMCVTDDRNPLIREYALLAVRNLMINNVGNQAIIKEMDPVGMVGPDGELREMPQRMGARK